MAKLRIESNTLPMTNIHIDSWLRFVVVGLAWRSDRFVNADQSNVAYSPRKTDANELNERREVTNSKVQ